MRRTSVFCAAKAFSRDTDSSRSLASDDVNRLKDSASPTYSAAERAATRSGFRKARSIEATPALRSGT